MDKEEKDATSGSCFGNRPGLFQHAIRIQPLKLPHLEMTGIFPILKTSIPNPFASTQAAFAPIRAISDQFASCLNPIFESSRKIQAYFEQLPDNMRHALNALGEHGWFIYDEMDSLQPIVMAKLALEGKPQDLDDAMTSYYWDEMDNIIVKVEQLVPRRAKLIRMAMDDCKSGRYEPAIQQFLSQGDGLCIEITGNSFFTRERGKNDVKRPATAKYVDQFASDPIEAAFLYPLQCVLPINKNQGERTQADAGKLNRHTIMHGEDVDYGTRINAMKSLSFFCFSLDLFVNDSKSKNDAKKPSQN
jgi:hypothetical protein